MKKQQWLIAGLSLAMAASLGIGLSACDIGKKPDTPAHTHTYDTWDHDDAQHWKYCDEHGTDKSNIDESTKAAHDFSNGNCVCGMAKPEEGGEQGGGDDEDTPDADLDTRAFYVVGGGMGTLKNGTWDGPKAGFQFAKAPHKDADGNTVYTFTMELYSADEFKFIEENAITQETDESGNSKAVWHDELVFTLTDLDVSSVTGAFARASETSDNITVQKDMDGEYEFTIRTQKDGDMKANKVEVRLIKKLEPLGVESQYEMYLVGKIASKATSDWPSMIGVEGVPSKCYKMELQEDGETFYIEVELSGKDQFKVWNYKVGNANAGYYPTGVEGNLSTHGAPDGWYSVTWKVGDSDVTVAHAHRYTAWDYDTEEHWKKCPQDNEKDQTTVAAHDFSNGDTCECGYKQEADPNWKIDADGTFQEYTGGYENIVIPANLKVFPDLTQIFGVTASNLLSKENLSKLQSLTVAPGSKSFKIENNALLSMDGTILYMYLPYSTETQVTFENVTEIMNNAFIYNSTITSVNFPALLKINSYVFYNASALTTISMPLLETIAGTGAFGGTALKTVELENLKTSAVSVFTNCQELTSLVFGDKVTELGATSASSVFCNVCPKLESITIKAVTPPKIGTLYRNCAALTHIYVPAESVETYKTANKWSSKADKITAIPTEAVSAPAEVAMLPEKKD